MKPSLKLLKVAREVMAGLNLTKGVLCDRASNPTCCCAVGALYIGSLKVGPVGYSKAVDTLEKTARGRGASGIVKFNDAAATTKEDVLSLYDEAIASLEAA